MCKLGHCCFPAKSSVKHHVQRAGRQPLFASYHMRYLHQVVINNVCKVISRHSVRLIQHLVVQKRRVHLDVSPYQVVKLNQFIFGKTKAYHIRLLRREQTLNVLLRERMRVSQTLSCGTIILKSLLLCFSLLSFCVKFFGCIESIVCPTLFHKLQGILFVDWFTLRLFVGTKIAPYSLTFVKRQAEPLERLYDIIFRTLNKASTIGIFNSQNKISAVLFGKKIIVQSRPDAPNVQRTCRTWSKSHSYSSFHRCYIIYCIIRLQRYNFSSAYAKNFFLHTTDFFAGLMP